MYILKILVYLLHFHKNDNYFSNIQMEKTGIISEYLTMLNKVNMYKVLMCTKQPDQAQICMNQAAFIVQKYGLNFNLNIDIKKILLENSSTTGMVQQSPVVPKQVSEQRIEENTGSFDENDGDVVNPMEFFSE